MVDEPLPNLGYLPDAVRNRGQVYAWGGMADNMGLSDVASFVIVPTRVPFP